MYKIRLARKEDCAQIFNLVKELALFERAPQEVSVTLEEMELAGFGPKQIWRAFVAEGKNGIIGFALYYIRYSTWKGNRMYLEDILVTEKERGNGIGKLLFEELIEECKRENLNGMVWQVLDWNEPAIDFYKNFDTKFDSEWINCSLPIENLRNKQNESI